MQTVLHYFRWPFGLTLLGLVLAFWLGWGYADTLNGALSFLAIAAVLAVLEISLSFDNAIVNANKLRDMTPEWQRRFLTWGIVIAVFGMRIVFPLLIVVVAADLGPIEALRLAALHPAEYARIIEGAHVSIAGFGGAFLMMVALNYFIDDAKDVDWIAAIERRLRACASIRGLEIGLVLSIALLFATILPEAEAQAFLFAAVAGLVTFLAVEVLGQVLDRASISAEAAKGGIGAFLYLEVLDASFSFDGVIGAFALTHNLFLIAIGLGIGALYVRSMTIMLVERNTLAHFRYLEHGAFWSILILSMIMFAQTLAHIPELVTGLLGAGFIGFALMSSVRFNRLAQGLGADGAAHLR
ncbi:DUF475 domain-containing protein [Pseudothioclava nitratireducens]|uniref:DUF475 domain-containing protein n=1 Tax=Pseudothioclava nitratireducens TaxID=1928646 RepID=UPI0023D9B9C1|nr:DUF475 domain-containing protein [Defluviimonas nitratireducens]MDF1621520.1 DUF475 domain-containing protein [Defluviimonas nitratireducens]